MTRFGGGAAAAGERAALLFAEGESAVASSLFHFNGPRQLGPLLWLRAKDAPDEAGIEFSSRNPRLRDTRYAPNPDPRPSPSSPALLPGGEQYVGAFGSDANWLEEWTFFGPESDYDTREADSADDQP